MSLYVLISETVREFNPSCIQLFIPSFIAFVHLFSRQRKNSYCTNHEQRDFKHETKTRNGISLFYRNSKSVRTAANDRWHYKRNWILQVTNHSLPHQQPLLSTFGNSIIETDNVLNTPIIVFTETTWRAVHNMRKFSVHIETRIALLL